MTRSPRKRTRRLTTRTDAWEQTFSWRFFMARCFIGAFLTSCEHKTTVLESSCVMKIYLRRLEDVVDRKSGAPVKDWNSEDIQLPWGMSNNSRSSYWAIKTTCSKYHFHLFFLVVTWWFTLRTHFDVLIKNLLQRSILNSIVRFHPSSWILFADQLL